MLLFLIISSKVPSTHLHSSEKQLNGIISELWNIMIIYNKINLRIDLHWKSMVVLDSQWEIHKLKIAEGH